MPPKVAGQVHAWLTALDQLVPGARKDVAAALAMGGERVPWSKVSQALTRRDYGLASQLVMAGVEQSIPTLDAAVKTMVRNGLTTGGTLAAAEIGTAFDVLNPEAIRWARERAGALVTEVRAGTGAVLQKQLQGVITRSQMGDLTVNAAAKEIRGIVGLDPRRAQALVNYRTQLYAGKTGPLTPQARAVLDAKADRYAAKLLRSRAETIARTEILAAGNRGQLAVWEEAARNGTLPPNRVKKWIVTPDDVLCPKCKVMKGLLAPLNAPFPGTSVMTPPLHPNCRCTMGLSVDPKAPRQVQGRARATAVRQMRVSVPSSPAPALASNAEFWARRTWVRPTLTGSEVAQRRAIQRSLAAHLEEYGVTPSVKRVIVQNASDCYGSFDPSTGTLMLARTEADTLVRSVAAGLPDPETIHTVLHETLHSASLTARRVRAWTAERLAVEEGLVDHLASRLTNAMLRGVGDLPGAPRTSAYALWSGEMQVIEKHLGPQTLFDLLRSAQRSDDLAIAVQGTIRRVLIEKGASEATIQQATRLITRETAERLIARGGLQALEANQSTVAVGLVRGSIAVRTESLEALESVLAWTSEIGAAAPTPFDAWSASITQRAVLQKASAPLVGTPQAVGRAIADRLRDDLGVLSTVARVEVKETLVSTSGRVALAQFSHVTKTATLSSDMATGLASGDAVAVKALTHETLHSVSGWRRIAGRYSAEDLAVEEGVVDHLATTLTRSWTGSNVRVASAYRVWAEDVAVLERYAGRQAVIDVLESSRRIPVLVEVGQKAVQRMLVQKGVDATTAARVAAKVTPGNVRQIVMHGGFVAAEAAPDALAASKALTKAGGSTMGRMLDKILGV